MYILIKITQKYLSFLLIFSTLGANAQSKLILSEIMANPNNGQLPNAEFIEIYNHGDATAHLEHYFLHINNTSIALPSSYLAPKQFMLLTSVDNQQYLERFGNVTSLSRWPALNNAGAYVALVHRDGSVADAVTYSDRWYQTPAKRNGGWTLERINPNISCDSEINWRASEALMGGTPNQRNSIWDERYKPTIEPRVISIEQNSILLAFSIPVSPLTEISLDNWKISPGNIRITAIEKVDQLLKLTTSSELQAEELYTLDIQDFLWCNHVYQESVTLFRSSSPVYNDVVINEVLFNPKPEGVDFVEIYNRSDKILNLQGWLLGNRTVSMDMHLLYPSEYRVLTTDPDKVKQHYPTSVLENFIRLSGMPPYANERGQVILKAGPTTVDSLFYVSSMHQPFLTNVKGISLERQHADVDTHEPGNFSSASTLLGGATPGYKNSTDVEKNITKNNIFLTSKTCSPNGDGFEDLLLIHYEFQEANPMLNLTIFNDKGRIVNRLIRHKSAGREGTVAWDGLNENGQKCPSGIYIIWAEIYTDKGLLQSFKESFVLVNEGVGY